MTQTRVELYYGDCLQVMQTLRENSVAMAFCDPPYKIPRYISTACDWDLPFDLHAMWACLSKVSCVNAANIFTAAQPFTNHLINTNLQNFRYCLVWDKRRPGNFTKAKIMPMRFHEDIAVFYRQRPAYNPQMVARDKPRIWKACIQDRSLSAGVTSHSPVFAKTYTHRYPSSILQFSMAADRSRGLHPTQKPVALLEWLIKTYSDKNDTILDPVSGSATTAIAAIRTGRNVICIEKDRTYFEAGVKRVREEVAASGVDAEVFIHG